MAQFRFFLEGLKAAGAFELEGHLQFAAAEQVILLSLHGEGVVEIGVGADEFVLRVEFQLLR